MSSENKALMRRWFQEVWNQGSVSAIDEMMAADGVVHGLGPADLHGPAEFKTFHAAYRDAFPDVVVDIEELIDEGHIVAVRWSASGTHRGAGLGFPATGKHAKFSGMLFARVQHGKLVEGWNSLDQLGMLQQLGVVNLPANG